MKLKGITLLSTLNLLPLLDLFELLELFKVLDFLFLEDLSSYKIICSGLLVFEKVIKLLMIELLLISLIL